MYPPHLIALCFFALVLIGNRFVKADYELSIIHINDFHSRFEAESIDATTCKEDDECHGGFSRMYKVIMDLLPTRSNYILLNAGDNFQGNLWYTTFKWHVIAKFMNLLPFTAYTLGNHEFDDAIEGVVPFLENLNAPCLVSNIDDSKEPDIQNLYQKSIIREIGGKKIGIIGVILKTTDEIANTEELIFLDEIESVNKEAERLVTEEPDLFTIIVLSHCGYETEKKMAEKSHNKIGLIVGAHSHSLLYTGEPPDNGNVVGPYPTVVPRESDGKDVLVVQASSYTRYVGDIIVIYDEEGQVKSSTGNPIYLSGDLPEDEHINEMMKPYKTIIDKIGQEVLGETQVFLDDNCYNEECNFGNLITDAMVDAYIDLAEGDDWTYAALAITNSGGIRSPIQIGNITFNDMSTSQPFGNTFDVGELQGKYILEFLEQAATPHVFRKPKGTMRTDLFLLQLSGFQVMYDTTRDIGQRVKSVKLRCQKCKDGETYEDLDPEKYYRLVVPSFLGGGGDGFNMIPENMRNYKEGPVDMDYYRIYLEKASPIKIGIEGRINFYTPSGDGQKLVNLPIITFIFIVIQLKMII